MYFTEQTQRFQRWTQSAIECYERGGICDGCPIKSIIQSKCVMKHSIIELVRYFGAPPKNFYKFFNGITAKELEVAQAIVSGANTKAEIAEILDLKTPNVQMYIDSLCKLAIQNGHRFKKNTYRLKELAQYLRKAAKEL